jgi:membrane associated rhomboid family serine protease
VLPIKDLNPTRSTPVVTWLILAACIGIYFLWQPSPAGETVEDTEFAFHYAAIPCEVKEGRPLTRDEVVATLGDAAIGGDETACEVGSPASEAVFPGKSSWLALLTSMFLHGSLLHLGGNMLFLWIFGNNIEDHLGHLRYALFYVVGGVVASGAHIMLNLDSTIPVVGASGAIAAVMGAYLVWFPDAPVRTVVIFFLITVLYVRAKWLLGFWFLTQFFTSPNSGVAWAAHVGGFVFGVVIGLLVRESRAMRRAAWRGDYVTPGPWDSTGGGSHRW